MILLINNAQCLTGQKVSSLSRLYTKINSEFRERESNEKGEKSVFFFFYTHKFSMLGKLPVSRIDLSYFSLQSASCCTIALSLLNAALLGAIFLSSLNMHFSVSAEATDVSPEKWSWS